MPLLTLISIAGTMRINGSLTLICIATAPIINNTNNADAGYTTTGNQNPYYH